MPQDYQNLNSEKALIWRIIHRQNIPWILRNGLQSESSTVKADAWVVIGNEDLISRRRQRAVPVPPGGVLSDYIPFYFTPFSPMMYNIHTGWAGVRKVPNRDIVILVSSLHKAAELGLQYVFTDRHAYSQTARYFNQISELDNVDWPLLRQRDFQRDPDDPEKVERCQAEALVYGQLPTEALLGVVCYNQTVQESLIADAQQLGIQLNVLIRHKWYF